MSTGVLTQASYRELDAAFESAVALVEIESEAEGWTDDATTDALYDVADAHADADESALESATQLFAPALALGLGWYATEAERTQTFWTDLAGLADTWPPNDLAPVFRSAAGTAELEIEWEEAGDTSTIVIGGLEETASEAGDVAQASAEAVEQNPWIPVVLAGGAIVVVLAVLTQIGGRTVVIKK